MNMTSSPSELTLDCKPRTYSMLLKSFGDLNNNHHQHDQAQKLEEFLSRLEEERLKIDAFKRELPLCMQLLTNALEASRQQLQSYSANNHGAITGPVLEEFIPLKNSSGSEANDQKAAVAVAVAANATSDKANWMTSAQLWSQGNNNNNNNEQKHPSKETHELGFSTVLSPSKLNNGGAVFLPFSREQDNSNSFPSPTLALASPDNNKEVMEEKNNNNLEIVNLGKCSNGAPTILEEQGKTGGGGCGGGGATLPQPQDSQATVAAASNSGGATQPHRKARRCWSPDLHRRFVNALQMLGGSQVATPKQIREFMKVDGLTNDEVKSHLQKYRLHTRRPGPTPQVAATSAPQLVVLGGIWVPPEYTTAAAHGGAQPAATLYGGAHPATHAHLSTHQHFSVGHDFYAAAAPPPQHLPLHHHAGGHPLHHHHHQQFHVYNKPPHSLSHAQSSPESDGRGNAGGRSESIEDGKSESGSWKADSGGGGERKALAALREDGEVSNGSDITLKF